MFTFTYTLGAPMPGLRPCRSDRLSGASNRFSPAPQSTLWTRSLPPRNAAANLSPSSLRWSPMARSPIRSGFRVRARHRCGAGAGHAACDHRREPVRRRFCEGLVLWIRPAERSRPAVHAGLGGKDHRRARRTDSGGGAALCQHAQGSHRLRQRARACPFRQRRHPRHRRAHRHHRPPR